MASALRPYRTSLLATLVVIAIGAWPLPIMPIADAYVAFCARYLTGAPAGHHYPPLVVAFLAPIVVALVTCFLISVVRQAWRQHRLDTAVTSRQASISPLLVQMVCSLGLNGRVCVTTDQTIYAFCGGFIRPHIYLSQGLVELLTLGELEAVLRHERRHLTQRDPLRYFVTDLMGHLTPLFPALAVWRARVHVHAELAADQAVLKVMPVDVLAGALVKVMRASTPSVRQPIVAALSPDQARVAALVGQPTAVPYPRYDVVMSLTLGITTLTVLAWLALQPALLPAVCDVCPPSWPVVGTPAAWDVGQVDQAMQSWVRF